MGYDYKPEFAAARGQVITLRVKRLNVPSAKATSIPLPTLLSGVGVRVTSHAFDNYPQRLPIFSIISSDPSDGCCPLTYIMVEIPTNAGVNTILLALEVDGNAGPSFQMAITDRQPHIVNACDTIVDTGICSTLVQHADGTFVGDAGYPNGKFARPGETITFYAVGLGATVPPVPTGQASPVSPLATIGGNALPLIVSYVLSLPPASPAPPIVWMPVGRWIYPSYIGLVPGYVGLYQVNVTLPAELAQAQASATPECEQLTVRIAIGAGSGLGREDIGPMDGATHVDVCVRP